MVSNPSKGGMLKATFVFRKINLDSIGKVDEARIGKKSRWDQGKKNNSILFKIIILKIHLFVFRINHIKKFNS